jgi:hypothetical protein
VREDPGEAGTPTIPGLLFGEYAEFESRSKTDDERAERALKPMGGERGIHGN